MISRVNKREPLTEAELGEIERTAKDLLDAIRLDDSIAGWPEHFDEDFSEALDPVKALRLVAEVRRFRATLNQQAQSECDDCGHAECTCGPPHYGEERAQAQPLTDEMIEAEADARFNNDNGLKFDNWALFQNAAKWARDRMAKQAQPLE